MELSEAGWWLAPNGWVCAAHQEGCAMGVSGLEARGLAHGIVGSARVIAFGTSIVAPAASVITVLVVMMAYAGFASPLVVLIAFAGSLCCAAALQNSPAG